MMSWRKVMMFAALLILTSAAYDLFVVDFWLPAFCDEASSQGSSKPTSSDDCFCCCSHIVLTTPTLVEPLEITRVAEFVPPASLVSAAPTGIYHPPRI
jgi:hypothetical protein